MKHREFILIAQFSETSNVGKEKPMLTLNGKKIFELSSSKARV